MPEPFTIDPSANPPLGDLPDELKNVVLPPQVGLAAVALNYALKYADTITCKDGTLYQQFKLEGKNMTALHLDEVFHYAAQIEKHLLEAPSRLALMVLEAVCEDVEDAIDSASVDRSGEAVETGNTDSTEGESAIGAAETPDPSALSTPTP